MNKQFDMEIFLAGVLTGAHATRERHVRQAKLFKQPFLNAGTEIIHGPSKENISFGF